MATSEEEYRIIPEGDPHYAAIGLVASNWARLERTADEAIWELLQAAPPLSASVTAQMLGLRSRMSAIKGLLESLGASDDSIARVERLFSSSYGLNDQRNRIVHDPWFYNTHTGERARYAATVDKKGKPVLDFVGVSKDELADIAKRIHDLDQKMWETLDTILQTFRDTRRGWFSVSRV
ncbi:hypothetical protein LB567_12895 [Mesorhizobium sp. B264B1A]|uniref:hypothetical protein n=2 Tax=Mesorhizobium TaxID=68287 RepID=UPI001127DD95|nr:hypothetical protein [Mesorhizobium sp. B264B1B]MCA0019135.1 hypothetical protein [Mesorhizobium sp. B264B1A]